MDVLELVSFIMTFSSIMDYTVYAVISLKQEKLFYFRCVKFASVNFEHLKCSPYGSPDAGPESADDMDICFTEGAQG